MTASMGQGRLPPLHLLVGAVPAVAGQSARATELFERVTAYTNDLGLLSEEVNPATGELMGNFPQAFSHVGLVNAAWALSTIAGPEDRPAASVSTPA